MALVDRTCVDRWEAHLVQLQDHGGELRHSPYERPIEGARYAARSAMGTVPQAYVNRDEASNACANGGKRLCSLLEWYQACRGARGTTWPYGNHMVRGKCNASKPHLLSRMYGSNPRAWKYAEHFNDPKLNQEPGFLAPTGTHSECVSDYGVYDMVGNLHEWVTDAVGPSLATKIPLRQDIHRKLVKNTGKAIFMGGFFSTTSEHGRGCAFVTIGHEKAYHDYSTGFRCCKAPASRAPTNLSTRESHDVAP
jgi:formylglycine-generating enzyme required for sulfatase activity